HQRRRHRAGRAVHRRAGCHRCAVDGGGGMNTNTEKAMNLYQRINAVRKAINYIRKDKAVSTGGGSYRAVTHDAVTGLVRQHLIEHGVIIAPTLIESEFHPREEGAKQRLYAACYEVRFINMDAPEECISIRIEAHAL